MYNGHGSMPLTPIAERLAVELLIPVLTTWVYRGWEYVFLTLKLH